MEYHAEWKASDFKSIPLGGFFAFKIAEATHLALAVEPERNGKAKSALVIYPGHPDLGDRPGILLSSAIQSPVLHFPKASVRLPQNLDQIHLGQNELKEPAGALYLVDDNPVITGFSNKNLIAFSLVDGQSVVLEDTHRLVWFSAWEIGELQADGTWTRLCTIKATRD